jgi:hypothetical protein
MENFNEFEKAAICLHIFGGCEDKKTLFKIACGEQRYNKLSPNSLKSVVSTWYKSHKVQQLISYYQHIKKTEQDKAIEEFKKLHEASGDTEAPKKESPKAHDGQVDFLNLEEFLKYANQQANDIADEKERRAWVEMIGKYMNFKDNEDGEQEQIKAYIPINCESCELYKRCKGCKLSECPQ